MKKIAVLGSSGSIGIQTLDFIRKTKNEFKVCGLSVNSNIELLKRQIKEFNPSSVSTGTSEDAEVLKKWCKKNNINTKVYYGIDGLNKIATLKETDLVLFSVVGAVGLEPLLKAIEARKNIAIANKESLVMSGSVIMQIAKEKNVKILPVDSEHSAVFQCIGEEKKRIRKKNNFNRVRRSFL